EVLDTPWPGCCNRLSAVRGARCGREHRARIGDRRSDEVILTSSRFVLYGRARTASEDACGARRRPSSGVAEPPRAEPDQGPQATQRLREQHPDERRPEI